MNLSAGSSQQHPPRDPLSVTGTLNARGSLPAFEESDFYLNMDDVLLGAQIGQGAFSKVYVGKYLGELVAVKKQKRAVNDGLETYLLRELAVLKHFEHPNLLSYLGASDVPGEGIDGASAIYIVTELAEHGDLLALLLGNYSLGWKLRVSMLLDAARALEFLHSKSLIHRDIKSPNMLLDLNFNCKIADFGMARQIGTNMTIVGTDAYMAPELMFDEPYDTSADMFSFGIVLWETIYRRKAGFAGFAERTPAERFRLDVDALNAGAPEDAPPSLLMLAAQLCEYEPGARPTAEDAFMWLEDLHNELSDEAGADGERCCRDALAPIDYEALFASEPAVCVGPSSQLKRVGTAATAAGSTISSSAAAGGGGGGGSTLPVSKRPPVTPLAPVGGGAATAASSSSRSQSPGTLRGATHAPITKCGYLHKKGKTGLKNWQRRWFVLEGTKLIWYKDSKNYPKEPRGYLELRGCFIVRGLFFRWKILNADGAADQEDYNRELAAKDAGEMEQWLTALQNAMDAADTGEGLPPKLENALASVTGTGISRRESVEGGVGGRGERVVSISLNSIIPKGFWLATVGLTHLAPAFEQAGYTDMLLIQEMGINSEDLNFIGVKSKTERRLLKMAARGVIERLLVVRVSGFFNFGAELVYRLDSRWRFLRASTFFRFQDFEELHRKVKAAMKDTKYSKLMPSLPTRPTQSVLKLGSIDHAAQMARLQQALHSYMQKLTTLVGTKEPFFTMLCGHLDLLPPDPLRLPERSDDFLAKVALQLGNSMDSPQGIPSQAAEADA
ncbi:LISK family protein kinase [Tribonema minus]|uniref:LISK family protein kinase n=1 Tax=Tribonema minus TaxID=303371 RepID=A0A835ZKA0_9STRA|nr:LISK family protein kinase [Tribonema minus]